LASLSGEVENAAASVRIEANRDHRKASRPKHGRDRTVADAISRVPTEELDWNPLDNDIPVLAIDIRAGDSLEAAVRAKVSMGALLAQEISLEDAFCQKRLRELDAQSLPEPKWSRKAFFV